MMHSICKLINFHTFVLSLNYTLSLIVLIMNFIAPFTYSKNIYNCANFLFLELSLKSKTF